MKEENLKFQKFTLQLALVDALPVLFFGAACVVLGGRLQSGLFFAGAILCLLAGAGKVLWKLLIALAGKDVQLLGAQLRYLMPAGLILMVAGVVRADKGLVASLLRAALQMPAILFFILSVAGIVGMVVCSRRFERHDVRGNWIEQCINAAAQGCLLIGVLLL